MKRLKIAFVVQRYGLEVNGGAELHCRQLTERLSKIYDIEIITTKAIDYITWADEYSNDIDIVNDITVRRFSVDYERDVEKFRKYTEYILDKSKQHTLEEEIDWVRAQGPYSSGMLDYISSNVNSYDIFLFISYNYSHVFFGLPMVKDKAILIPTAHDDPSVYLKSYKHIFNIPAGIFYNTKTEMKMINAIMKNEAVFDNDGNGGTGVEIERPDRQDGSFDKYKDYILYIGRIDVSKGCGDLFSFFIRYIKETGRDIRLLLAGKPVMDIPDDERIIPLGFIDDDKKAGIIYNSRVVVIPSEYESLSMVLLEAMKLSIPVLVNGRCDVLKDHCLLSNAGLYYCNYQEFAGMMDFLLDNKEVSRKMGINGEAYVERYYQWDDIVNRLSDMIEKIADGINKQDYETDVQKIISGIKHKNNLSDIPYALRESATERFHKAYLDDFFYEKKQQEIFEQMLFQYRNQEYFPIKEKNMVNSLKNVRNRIFSVFVGPLFKRQDKFNRLVLEMINEMMLKSHRSK